MSTIEEAKIIYKTAIKVMNEGNFNLRKWSTNDQLLAEFIKDNNQRTSQKVESRS